MNDEETLKRDLLINAQFLDKVLYNPESELHKSYFNLDPYSREEDEKRWDETRVSNVIGYLVSAFKIKLELAVLQNRWHGRKTLGDLKTEQN